MSSCHYYRFIKFEHNDNRPHVKSKYLQKPSNLKTAYEVKEPITLLFIGWISDRQVFQNGRRGLEVPFSVFFFLWTVPLLEIFFFYTKLKIVKFPFIMYPLFLNCYGFRNTSRFKLTISGKYILYSSFLSNSPFSSLQPFFLQEG